MALIASIVILIAALLAIEFAIYKFASSLDTKIRKDLENEEDKNDE